MSARQAQRAGALDRPKPKAAVGPLGPFLQPLFDGPPHASSVPYAYQATAVVCAHCLQAGVLRPLWQPALDAYADAAGPWETDFSTKPIPGKAMTAAEKRRNESRDALEAMKARAAGWASPFAVLDELPPPGVGYKERQQLPGIFDDIRKSRTCPCRGQGADGFAEECLRLTAKEWQLRALDPASATPFEFGLEQLLLGCATLQAPRAHASRGKRPRPADTATQPHGNTARGGGAGADNDDMQGVGDPSLLECPTVGEVFGDPFRCGGCLCSRYTGSVVVCPAARCCHIRTKNASGRRPGSDHQVCACHSTRHAVATNARELLHRILSPRASAVAEDKEVRWDLEGVLGGRGSAGGSEREAGLRAKWGAFAGSDQAYRGVSTAELWDWLGGAPASAPCERAGAGSDPNCRERVGPSLPYGNALSLRSLWPPLSRYRECQQRARDPGLVSSKTKVLWRLLLDPGARPVHEQPAQGASGSGGDSSGSPGPQHSPYTTVRPGKHSTWEEQRKLVEERDHRQYVRRFEEEGLYRVGAGTCRLCNCHQLIGPPQTWRYKKHGARSPSWNIRGGERSGERPAGWFCGHCKEGERGTYNTVFQLYGEALDTPGRRAAVAEARKFLNKDLSPEQVAEGAKGLRPRPAKAEAHEPAQEPATKRRRAERTKTPEAGKSAAKPPSAAPDKERPDEGGNWMRLKDPAVERDLRTRNQGGAVQVPEGPEGDRELRYPSAKMGDIPIRPSQLTELQRFVCNLSDAERQVVARIKVHGKIVRIGQQHGGVVYKGGNTTLFNLPLTDVQGKFPTLPKDSCALHIIAYQKGYCTASQTATFHPSLIFRPKVCCLFLALMAEYGPSSLYGAEAPGRDEESYKQLLEWSEQWEGKDLEVQLNQAAGRDHYRFNLMGDPSDRPGDRVDLGVTTRDPSDSILTQRPTPAQTPCWTLEQMTQLLERGEQEVAATETEGPTDTKDPQMAGQSVAAEFRCARMLYVRAKRKLKRRPPEQQTAAAFAEYYCKGGKKWANPKSGAHAPMSDPRGCPMEYVYHMVLRQELAHTGMCRNPDGRVEQDEEDALKRDVVEELDRLRAERVARGEELVAEDSVVGTTGAGAGGEGAENHTTLPRAIQMSRGESLKFWEDRHELFDFQAFPDKYLWGEGSQFRTVKYQRVPALPPEAAAPAPPPTSDPPPPEPAKRERRIRDIDQCTGQGRKVTQHRHFNLLLQQADGRFRHHLHTYWIFSYQQKLDRWAHARLIGMDDPALGLSAGERIVAGDPNIHRKLRTEAAKIRGVGKGDPREGEERLREIMQNSGSPAFFFTMSAFDHNHPFYQQVALWAAIAAGDEPAPREISDLSGERRRTYAIRYALYVNEAIMHFVHCFLHLFFMPYLGAARVELVVEFQHRGAPHVHALIWVPEWSQLPPECFVVEDPLTGGHVTKIDPAFAGYHDHLVEQRLRSDKFKPRRCIPHSKHIPDEVDPTRFGFAELSGTAGDTGDADGAVYNEKEDFAALQVRCMQHKCKAGVCLSYDPKAPGECRADHPHPPREETTPCLVGRKKRFKIKPVCNKQDLTATCYQALLACRCNCNLQVCTETEATFRYVVKYMRKKEPEGRRLVEDSDALRQLDRKRVRYGMDSTGVARAALQLANAGREYSGQECVWWIAINQVTFSFHNLPPGVPAPRARSRVSTSGGGDLYFNQGLGVWAHSQYDQWEDLTEEQISAAGLQISDIDCMSYDAFCRSHKTVVKLPQPAAPEAEDDEPM